MKKHNLLKYAAAVCLFAVCLLCSATKVKADYINDEANGVRYSSDEVYISKGYAHKYANGGADYVTVYLENDGDRVVNVKSNSKNLLAKKTSEDFYIRTSSDYDYDQDKYVTTTENEYDTAVISFFGKKKGTYKVTFDVIDKTGKTKCTKTITVHVDKYVSTSTKSAIKSITYAGKDIWEHYPYCSKAKGKLKVKLNKGYSLVSISVETRTPNGEWKLKKVKNGKTIKLAKTGKYTLEDSWSATNYNPIFPETRISITVKHKKTKATTTYGYYLYTLSKK